MPLSFEQLTLLPDPPLKTSPANFAQRADAFLDALPAFQVEFNGVITNLNSITSGLDQQTPIAAWSAATTYNFPTVVAGSDGYSYRCVGVDVLNVDPITDDGTNWVNIGSGSSIVGAIEISADATAVPRFLHILTESCTLNLPSSPQNNTPISIINLSGTLTSVINPGTGGKINGIEGPMTVDILNITVNLLYSGSEYGWIIL